jgi:hypothetical protein
MPNNTRRNAASVIRSRIGVGSTLRPSPADAWAISRAAAAWIAGLASATTAADSAILNSGP